MLLFDIAVLVLLPLVILLKEALDPNAELKNL
jgi:hypothetical protein